MPDRATELIAAYLRGGVLDEFPKARVVLQRLVFSQRQIGSELKILECVPAQDAVDHKPQFVPLEIEAVIAQPESVRVLPPAPSLPKRWSVCNASGQASKLAEDFQLRSQVSWLVPRARRIKDDLKRLHSRRLGFGSVRDRTHLSALRARLTDNERAAESGPLIIVPPAIVNPQSKKKSRSRERLVRTSVSRLAAAADQNAPIRAGQAARKAQE